MDNIVWLNKREHVGQDTWILGKSNSLLYSQLGVTVCSLENIFGLDLYRLIYLPSMLFKTGIFKERNWPTSSIRFEGLVTRYCSKQGNKPDRLPYSITAQFCVDFLHRDMNFKVWIKQYSATMFNRISKLSFKNQYCRFSPYQCILF